MTDRTELNRYQNTYEFLKENNSNHLIKIIRLLLKENEHKELIISLVEEQEKKILMLTEELVNFQIENRQLNEQLKEERKERMKELNNYLKKLPKVPLDRLRKYGRKVNTNRQIRITN
ncbi:hypothetical protein BCR32DRAFT_250091 [Anaeromyces robustus]|uniref:Uncharacterized protein n=1 Tax=Anaeromyces robustus TaxID=1754192 RepID=A0A1Y1WEE8_9FUNG|nr:hypothetical protein BCR32DRAFT_250091 [Anaeromyces robustus]|eukprot:ORX71708.1 hypothetical protein BCR32DRAFT_250091 [Anaeromyces robustus]